MATISTHQTAWVPWGPARWFVCEVGARGHWESCLRARPYIYLCIWVEAHVAVRRTTFRSQFPPSTTRAPGIELTPSCWPSLVHFLSLTSNYTLDSIKYHYLVTFLSFLLTVLVLITGKQTWLGGCSPALRARREWQISVSSVCSTE